MTHPTLTSGMIAAAETAMAVQYTDAERAQMLDNLQGQILAAVQRRAVPMATRFDPRLQRFKLPHAVSAQHLTPVTAALPASDADIAFAP